MTNLPARKSNRLAHFDYSQSGWYFVTICVKPRRDYFGEIKNEKMCLNEWGKVAQKYWSEIPAHYSNVSLDEFIIMPDHVHGIVVIQNNDGDATIVGTEQCSVPTVCDRSERAFSHPSSRISIGTAKRYGLLSKIVKSFKEACVKDFHRNFEENHFSWQRSFHDHIIRNQTSLNRIREYIQTNPLQYALDHLDEDFFLSLRSL